MHERGASYYNTNVWEGCNVKVLPQPSTKLASSCCDVKQDAPLQSQGDY